MSVVTRNDVWHCDVCGHEWLPGVNGEPRQCPSRKCRSSLWNLTENGLKLEPKDKRIREVVEQINQGKLTPSRRLDAVSENKGKVTTEQHYVRDEYSQE